MEEKYPSKFNGQSRLVMIAIISSIFLLSITGCSSNTETRKNEALASQQLAMAFLNEGRPARALNELAKADKLKPGDPEIQNMMGLAYWGRRDYINAELRFKSATELKPSFSEAWNNLGAFYIDQGRYEHAVEALDRALKNVYYSSYEIALSNLGWALYRLGRLGEAKNKMEESIEVNPSHPKPRLDLSKVLFDLGDYNRALVQVDEALKLYPEYAEAFLQKGKVLNKMGDREGAIAAFQRVRELSPASDAGVSAKTYLDFLK